MSSGARPAWATIRTMKSPLVLTALAVLALPLMGACAASPDLSDGAQALGDRLAELPQVSRVGVDYVKADPDPFLPVPGNVTLTVQMDEGAGVREVADVFTGAYEAFSDAHRDEVGDIDVLWGDDTVHLVSQGPEGEVAEVREAVERVLSVLPAGEVRADIDLRRLPGEDTHFKTFYRVTVPARHEDRGGAAVLRTLDDLAAVHEKTPGSTWIVETTRSTWGLMSVGDFPGAAQRALFSDLGADLPRGASVRVDTETRTLKVADTSTAAEVSAAVGRHLQVLGGVATTSYEVVDPQGDFLARFAEGVCYFAPSKVGDRIEAEHGAGCTVVPEPFATP